MLAAMEVPLSVAAAAARDSFAASQESAKPRSQTYSSGDLTVAEARKQFLEHLPRGHVAYDRTRTYWFLRMFDEQWLKSVARRPFIQVVPSVEEDRQSILGAKHFNGQDFLKRARLRDREWYEEFKASRHKASIKRRESQSAARHRERHKNLLKAIENLLSRPTRPTRITYAALGKLTGLTRLQALVEIKADPTLLRAVRDANDSKISRQLEWAVRVLVAERAPFGARQVFQKAKLPSTPSTAPLVKRLIETKARAKVKRAISP